MKLLNINIGIKINNAKQVAELIKNENADIVSIQEIVRHLESSVLDRYRSKARIETGIGKLYPYRFFGPLWITEAIRKEGKIFRSFGGLIEQGNEILSKYSIVEATNEHYYKAYSYYLDSTKWRQEDHARALEIVELQAINKRFQVLNIHGIWTEDKQGDKRTIEQCKYVVKASKRKNIPTIITGDFNLAPNTESIKIMNKDYINLIEMFEIKTTRPDFNDGTDKGENVVDYIFVSKDIKVKNFRTIDTKISDHLPLLLEFDI